MSVNYAYLCTKAIEHTYARESIKDTLIEGVPRRSSVTE